MSVCESLTEWCEKNYPDIYREYQQFVALQTKKYYLPVLTVSVRMYFAAYSQFAGDSDHLNTDLLEQVAIDEGDYLYLLDRYQADESYEIPNINPDDAIRMMQSLKVVDYEIIIHTMSVYYSMDVEYDGTIYTVSKEIVGDSEEFKKESIITLSENAVVNYITKDMFRFAPFE